MNTKPTLNVIYARTASPHGVDAALNRQLEEVKQRILAEGGNPDQAIIITEQAAAYAATTSNPGYQNVIRLIESGVPVRLYLTDLTRITRHAAAGRHLVSLLRQHSGELIITTLPTVSIHDPLFDMIFEMLISIAEETYRQTSARTAEGIARARVSKDNKVAIRTKLEKLAADGNQEAVDLLEQDGWYKRGTLSNRLRQDAVALLRKERVR